MPNIYEKNGHYFMKENSCYRLYDVFTRRNTIVLMPSDICVSDLENPKVYTYQELRNELIKGLA